MELKASKTKTVYWLKAYPSLNSCPKQNDTKAGIGKWQIYESRKNIDQAWQKIKGATESGQLTDLGAKVSTRKKKPVEIGGGTNNHVICIYTRDTPEHKAEVRDSLFKLGFVRYLPYKSDAATAAGTYSTKFRPTLRDNHSQPDDTGPVPESESEDESVPIPQSPHRPLHLGKRTKSLNISATPPKKWTPPTGNPIKVYVTDNSAYRYNNQRWVHVQQLYPPTSCNPPDVLFPIEQLRPVSQAFYDLSNTLPPPEGSKDQIVVLEDEKLTVKVWGERVSQFDGEFAIVMQHKKNKKKAMFLQSDGMFCYNRLEWFRTRPDIEGEDVFSSEEEPTTDDDGSDSDANTPFEREQTSSNEPDKNEDEN